MSMTGKWGDAGMRWINRSIMRTLTRAGMLLLAGFSVLGTGEALACSAATINGPTSINESDTSVQYTYNCFAGSVSGGVTWVITNGSAYVNITTSGSTAWITPKAIGTNVAINIRAYDASGSSFAGNKNVTISNNVKTLNSVGYITSIVYLSASGQRYINKGTYQQTLVAYFDDGSSQNMTGASGLSWSENSSAATISTAGVLDTRGITSNHTINITGSYTYNPGYAHLTQTKSIGWPVTARAKLPTNQVELSGPGAVNENTAAAGTYILKLIWDDGSKGTLSPTWSENSSYASISGSGVLSTVSVISQQLVTLTAQYSVYPTFTDYPDYTAVSTVNSPVITILNNERILTGLSISGPTSVNENSTATYTATATFDDGSNTVTPVWSENSAYAAIGSGGMLTSSTVTADQPLAVSASYTYNGVTKTASQAVTIVNSERILTGLSVSGASSLNENSTATYTATATFDDGSNAVTPVWSEDSVYAAIDNGGVLTAATVIANQPLTVTADYSYGGVTKMANLAVTIIDSEKRLVSLAIDGPASLSENGTAQYTATAIFDDASSQAMTSAAGLSWGENSAATAIDANGLLTAGTVSTNEAVTVSASYTYNSDTLSTNQSIVILMQDDGSNTIVRASVDGSGIQANGPSDAPGISSDGRFVVFASEASNLVAGDTNLVRDIFVYDRQTGATERVSVDTAGLEANGLSDAPGISSDGRFVAFASEASNLVAGDTNLVRDIFVYDRQTGVPDRLSLNSRGAEGDVTSNSPVISGDGRFVVFVSAATNLVAGDTNGIDDIFVRVRANNLQKSDVWLTLSSASVSLGEPLTVGVYMDFSDDPTLGGGIDITYDNLALAFDSFTPSAELGGDIALSRAPENLSIELNGLSFGDINGIGGPKLIGTVTFNTLTAGTTNLSLADNDAPVGGFYSAVTLVPQTVNYTGASLVIISNTAPVANAASIVTNEDTAINGALSASDAEANALTYSLITNGTQGVVNLTNTATGDYTYTPNANVNGTDAFTFKANDGLADSNTATVTVAINPVNDVPLANDGSLTMAEDTVVNGVLSGSDVDGDALTYSLVANGTQGVVNLTSATTGTYTYTPNVNANGTDTFTFRVNDGLADSIAATVTPSISPVNDVPVVVDDSVVTDEDVPLTTANVLANDFDPDGDALSIVNNTQPVNGTVSNNGDGTFIYTPSANFNGSDSFSYTVDDGNGGIATATVNITVNAVDALPIAADDVATVTVNGVVVVAVLDNDYPGDGPASVVSVSQGTNGSVGFNGSDTTYTPRPDFKGADSYTYTISDIDGDTSTATVSVSIVEEPGVPPTYLDTKTMGSSLWEDVGAVEVDSAGNVYITGSFYDTVDFDPGAGMDNHTAQSEQDIYVTKINVDGSYGWTRTMGGTMGGTTWAMGTDLAIDAAGSIYVTGYFYDTVDFDPGASLDERTSQGQEDIFLTKLNADGSYGWTKTMGGASSDNGRAVAIDANSNVYITGSFYDTVDFDSGVGTDTHTSQGVEDIFLTRINADGSYGWTKTLGGGSYDNGKSVVADAGGNIYVTGYFYDTADFDPGIGLDEYTSQGEDDIFITKINADGSYGWTKAMGGTWYDNGVSIAVDASDHVYVTGYFNNAVDFDPEAGVDLHTSQGESDVFLTKIYADGSYAWTKTFGGPSYNESLSLDLDGSGGVYISGYFYGSTDFDPGAGADTHTSQGEDDIFLTRLKSDGSYDWTRTMGGPLYDNGVATAVDSRGYLYVSGYFYSSALDFDPGIGVDEHSPVGEGDIFLTKFSVVWQDSDSDGMPDGFENGYGLNPNDGSDAVLDLDGDGISNLDEYLQGSDPSLIY